MNRLSAQDYILHSIMRYMPARLLVTYKSKGILIVLSVIFALVLLEVLLRVWGSIRVTLSQREMSGKGEFVILTLGESTTSAEYPDSWPSQMGKMLQDRYPGVTIQVVNKAKTGIQTSEAVGSINEYISVYRPRLIISMMGINDAYGAASDTSLFAPATKNASLKIIKLARLLYRYAEIGMRRYTDFVVRPSPERLNSIAAEFRRHGVYDEAEVYLHKSLELDDRLPATYVALSYLYRETGRIAEARQALQQLAARDPASDNTYHELGIFYRDIIHNDDTATEYFIKALEANDHNGQIYLDYGMHVIYTDEELAALMFDKAMMLRPDLYWAYFYRAELYLRSGNKKEAGRLYSEVLRIDPDNTVARMKMTQLSSGEYRGEVAGLADPAWEPYSSILEYPSSVQQSYARLIAAAAENGIPVIAMQYPLQPVAPLEELVEKVKLAGAVVSVLGNIDNFREALRTASYDTIFVDGFGGNFGHATREGNALIAENVAGAIDAIIAQSMKK